MLIRARRPPADVGMDFTPMIDMVFNLLIFFLVASSFHQAEREMRIALPIAQAAGPISAALRDLVINVDEAGAVFIAGRPVEHQALQDHVHELVRGNPEQKVTVRGDRRTAYANIVRVLDVCKRAGIQEPYLDTVLSE